MHGLLRQLGAVYRIIRVPKPAIPPPSPSLFPLTDTLQRLEWWTGKVIAPRRPMYVSHSCQFEYLPQSVADTILHSSHGGDVPRRHWHIHACPSLHCISSHGLMKKYRHELIYYMGFDLRLLFCREDEEPESFPAKCVKLVRTMNIHFINVFDR